MSVQAAARWVTRLALLSTLLQAADSNRLLEAVRKAGDLYRQGQQQEADQAAAQAISMLESRSDPPDFAVASSCNDLGALIYAKGDLEQAERFFARAREIYLALAGRPTPGSPPPFPILREYTSRGADTPKPSASIARQPRSANNRWVPRIRC